ncbi:hypothetical protein [uncultured Winogradskyella sp.]|uniref:hypothetical protein n=1 Tax=uncultured Winogradskyella sp. TaxID=395353 RepID=UPI002605C992|nr:hypothetical protein [uncultured Winogradskyella sp.]
MKTKMTFLFMIRYLLVLHLALVFFSCSDDDRPATIVTSCDDGVQNGNETGIDCGGSCYDSCVPDNALEGALVTRRVLVSNIDYKLTGPYIVRDGGTLEILAGTKIKAFTDSNAYIAVAQGGQIFIWGNADNPVVITSDSENPEAGDWGGLIICGQAPTNNAINSRSELGDIFYGGTDNETSSGVIRYLRLEYTGALFRDEKRFNALTFYGVGSFTTVQNIQAYESLGNGFEIFGGRINATNLVGLNTNLSGIKISGGWNGTGSSWYLSNQNKSGIELGNNEFDFSAEPATSATIDNVTINGPLSNSAIHYTYGGGLFNLNNVYTSQIQLGINVNSTTESDMIDNGNLFVNTIEFDNPLTNFNGSNYNGTTNFYTEGSTNGAGNRSLSPLWAENWTIGF